MKRRSTLLAGLAIALAAAALTQTAAAGEASYVDYNGTSHTYSCENTCMVFSDGRKMWVVDSDDGWVTEIGKNPYWREVNDPPQ